MGFDLKHITVQIDSREKYPLQFPSNVRIEHPDIPRLQTLISVSTEKCALKAGDYRLRECPDICIIERKASLLELNKNLMDPKDSVRQAKAFGKLRDACSSPILLLETSPWELLSPSARLKVIDPELVVNRLLRLAHHYKLELFWAGRTTSIKNRRLLGLTLIHLMLSRGIY